MASLGGLSGAQLEVVNNGAVLLEGAQALQAMMAQGSVDNSRVIQNEPGVRMAEGPEVSQILARQGSLGKGHAREASAPDFAKMLKDGGVDMKSTLASAAKPAPAIGQHTGNLGKDNGKGGGRGI